MDARMFEGCGTSRNFVSQAVDPDCAAGVVARQVHAPTAISMLERRCIVSSSLRRFYCCHSHALADFDGSLSQIDVSPSDRMPVMKRRSLGNPFSSIVRDVRYSLRALRKTPAFTAGAVVTVALTVGATTAIFSVVYGVLLRQLPYRHVEQVFWIWSDQPGRDRAPFNVPDFIDYRDSTRALAGFAGFFAYSANLSDEAAAERVQGVRATGNLFDVMGAHARIGRVLEPGDERPGAE